MMIFIYYIVKILFIKLIVGYFAFAHICFFLFFFSLVYCGLPVFYHCFIFHWLHCEHFQDFHHLSLLKSVQVMTDLQVISNHICTTNTIHAPVFLSRVSFMKVSWSIRTISTIYCTKEKETLLLISHHENNQTCRQTSEKEAKGKINQSA